MKDLTLSWQVLFIMVPKTDPRKLGACAFAVHRWGLGSHPGVDSPTSHKIPFGIFSSSQYLELANNSLNSKNSLFSVLSENKVAAPYGWLYVRRATAHVDQFLVCRP